MARADALARLAWAYSLHQARRRLTRRRPELSTLVEMYAADGIQPLTPAEQADHPRLTACINCGLCALAATRLGKTRLPDLAASYMRLYARLADASADLSDDAATSAGPDLAAVAAVCPVGVPLEDVAAIVRRLASG